MQENRVLSSDHRSSDNFYRSDRIFQHLLERLVSEKGRSIIGPKLEELGHRLAHEMDALSLQADKDSPELVKRNFYGENIDEIRFHPAYQRLQEIAVDSGMFRLKWEPTNREQYGQELHRLGFAAGYLYTMGEAGLYCPLCMTDGVARLIDRYASEEDKQRLLPAIYTEDASALKTGAMFLTEKAGGSDVGANLVSANSAYEDASGRYYKLNGEKWFCSNANADIIFALARTDSKVQGTRGLSIFLVEPKLINQDKQSDQTRRNPMNIIRLKDKLGVRSMASAEILLTDTIGKIVGEEGEGFRIMSDMINLSRLYNSVTAIGLARRALIEAYTFLTYRETFGKRTIEHALVRHKLHELGSKWLANNYLCWRTIEALDLADNGDEHAENLVRLLTPMVKKDSAEMAVYVIRECMELMGGIGYIEDGVVPKLMRDAMVLPIWEGAGNIMTLDMMRASFKSKGLELMYQEMHEIAAGASTLRSAESKQFIESGLEGLRQQQQSLEGQPREIQEVRSRYFFEELSSLYQYCLLHRFTDATSASWTQPAIDWMEASVTDRLPDLDSSGVEALIGWEI